MSRVVSVNVGRPRPNPYKTSESTGIAKEPQVGPVHVRPPGPRHAGLGSGVVGDHIGDTRHHGGDDQAVYAFTREDLDRWERHLDRPLPNGWFGENLTTQGIDVAECRLGERWRVGSELELEVRAPRIPCATFRGWMQETGWLKTFTADARPGAYLRVVRPGSVSAGDLIETVHTPEHDVTISLTFRALTTEPALLARLVAAADHLSLELRNRATVGLAAPAEQASRSRPGGASRQPGRRPPLR